MTTNHNVGISIGNTGTGTVNVNGIGATMTFTSATGAGYGSVGFNGGNTSVGTGTLSMTNGGLVAYNVATANGNFIVGRGAGSTGNVNVLSGGVLDLDGTTGQLAYVGIADTSGTTLGQMVVSGAGSVVRGANHVQVGFNGVPAAATHGELAVASGGLLDAVTVSIGSGGFLSGNGGAIDADVSVQAQGQLGDAGNLLQTMAITGSLTANGGTVELDIGAAGDDRYNVTGNLGFGINASQFRFDAVSGFTFAASEERLLVQVGGVIVGSVTPPSFTVTGQHADFGWIVGNITAANNNVSLRALTSGATGGYAILDFGAASVEAADFDYNATTNKGEFGGGVFGANHGGFTYNIDEVRGTSVNDVFTVTGAGAITLSGLGGSDTLTGGSGNDRLIGGTGDDALDGGAGIDTADYSAATNGVVVRLDLASQTAVGGAEVGSDTLVRIENIIGGAGGDTILAGAGDNVLTGNGGNDAMLGGGGNDTLYGGDGNDTLYGQDGNDTIDGGAGEDVIAAGIGDDIVTTGEGLNFVLAEEGNDQVTGGSLRDLLYGQAGNDALTGGDGADFLYGGTGLDVLFGDAGNDVEYGGDSRDWVYGFGGDDTLYGGLGDDVVGGGDGNDALYGDDGSDAMFGELGNDNIFGGAGNEYTVGGAGFNIISLGAGLDIVQSTASDGGTQYVTDFGIADFDQIWLVGTSHASTAALASAYLVGNDTYINNGADTVILVGINPNALNTYNFVLF